MLGERFKTIERFEVLSRDIGMGIVPKLPLPVFFPQFFGEMKGLLAWQEACPTLKKVVLYDLDIL